MMEYSDYYKYPINVEYKGIYVRITMISQYKLVAIVVNKDNFQTAENRKKAMLYALNTLPQLKNKKFVYTIDERTLRMIVSL